MWRKYFKIKGIRPGKVVFPGFGTIDFTNNNIDVDLLRRIFEADMPYLEMTLEGMDYFYGTQEEEAQPDTVDETLFKAKDLVKSINESTTEDQARYYFGLGKSYKSVQKAFDKKINDLQPE